MLGEGVAPMTIEQATTQAGYPVGALQLADELNMELFLKIRNESREAMGDAYVRHPAEDVVEKMVELGCSTHSPPSASTASLVALRIFSISSMFSSSVS